MILVLLATVLSLKQMKIFWFIFHVYSFMDIVAK